MLIDYFFIIIGAFLISAAIIFLLKKSSVKHKFLTPSDIPLVGGIGISASFILIYLAARVFLCPKFPEKAAGIIIASIIMFILGLVDDRHELSIGTKFFSQIAAASLLVFFGVRTHIVYIGEPLNILITFIWVIGVTNAFNHLDILDGLAGSVAIITGAGFLAVSLLTADALAAFLSAAVLGGACGFIIYNLPPAKVYMGNAGSHFLGFVFGTIAIVISYASMERKAALLAPLLIMGLPVFDTVFLVLARLKQKKSIFRKSDDHLALKFLKAGYSKRKTLAVMLALCLFFNACGVISSRGSNLQGIAMAIVVVFAGSLLIYKAHRVNSDGR